MDEVTEKIIKFVEYADSLKGDEKGEAQVFCDRLFQAFGHDGYKEAGATLEERIKGKKGTKFADLRWDGIVLIEMKSRKEKLERHYRQAFEYWLELVPHRPKYVILCNFDEFWIYDFDLQLEEPIDRIKINELPQRYTAFNFLLPTPKAPQFNNNLVAVTRSAADKVATVFNTLVERGEDRKIAQRFILQCVVAMFSEDSGLLPKGIFTEILNECKNGQSSYDLIGGLFRQMNTPSSARGGRFQKVRYFNGGIFSIIDPIELNSEEIDLLIEAANEQWDKVQPAIFGTLFEGSMGKEARHAFGAHFTNEADIQKIVIPSIVRPWREKIEKAKTLKELKKLRTELLNYKVLDPACGSGNFLYVAYRELKHLEIDLIAKIHKNFKEEAKKETGSTSMISTKQFFGIDNNPFAVELAKVTLMLAKELAIEELYEALNTGQKTLGLEYEKALPLDNLDENIICDDALFCNWPESSVIIGNPPYQSKNKVQKEYGSVYLQKLREYMSEVSGMADYCVYWFRKAHDHLKNNQRAGLVGTNTIRENYSRESGRIFKQFGAKSYVKQWRREESRRAIFLQNALSSYSHNDLV